jgi:hypothetical protein
MTSQFVDTFTKGLPSSVFLEFRSSLNICSDESFDCRGVGVLDLFLYFSMYELY